MAITTPTTWRYPDSTFGPQKQVPFNDNQQYPDCGPSIRIYTLENILYGLEQVITPLLEQMALNAPATANEKSATYTMTGTDADIGTADCSIVTIWLLSTAAANAQIIINGGEEIILEAGYSMTVNINSLTRIQAYQSGAEGDVLYYKYQ